jgi:plastocyanin
VATIARILLASAGAMLLPLALPATDAAAAPAPKVHTVVIDKMKFGPPPADLHAGDTILWVNRDMFRHTATARDGSFNVDLQPRASGKTAVSKAGQIAFFCKYHPGMKGTLAVQPRR